MTSKNELPQELKEANKLSPELRAILSKNIKDWSESNINLVSANYNQTVVYLLGNNVKNFENALNKFINTKSKLPERRDFYKKGFDPIKVGNTFDGSPARDKDNIKDLLTELKRQSPYTNGKDGFITAYTLLAMGSVMDNEKLGNSKDFDCLNGGCIVALYVLHEVSLVEINKFIKMDKAGQRKSFDGKFGAGSYDILNKAVTAAFSKVYIYPKIASSTPFKTYDPDLAQSHYEENEENMKKIKREQERADKEKRKYS